MLPSNPTEILLAHGQWATRNIMLACGGLDSEQFHRRFEMGLGSLHDTVTHLLSATRAWADLLGGRPERPRLEGTQRSIAELSPMLEEIFNDFNVLALSHPLDETVSRERNGKMYTFTRGGVVTHVTTHAMHHRAQCLNMLRHVGVKPLPLSSVLEWMITADVKA